MIYFVPAWYNAKRRWYATDNIWYEKTEIMDFDDIISQIRIFQQGDEEIELVVLNYSPNLRRFLHRQNLLNVKYWSVFDEIQGYRHDYVKPVNYLELTWPEDVSFHFNPFVVTVMRGDALFARIYLSGDGTLLSIKYYKNRLATFEHVFDDRGVLSSILMFDSKGKPQRQNYLDFQGDWIFSEIISSGEIDINPVYKKGNQKLSYENIDELIFENLYTHLNNRETTGDTLVLALDKQHNRMVYNCLDDENLILSQFRGRKNETFDDLVTRAQGIFSDSPLEEGRGFNNLPVLHIFSFYNRMSFGASAFEATLFISLFVDNITQETLEEAVATIALELEENPRTQLLLCTFRSNDLDRINELNTLASHFNEILKMKAEADENKILADELMGIKHLEERIKVTLLNRRVEIMQTIAKTRVFIDLGENINNHLSTEAINSGVPQINAHKNGFSFHKENGYFIHNVAELEEALNFFLDGLKNWNEAQVYYTQMIERNSDKRILANWDKIKEGFGHENSAD